MPVTIDPITGEINYGSGSNGGSPTSGDNRGGSPSTTRDSQATPQGQASSNVKDQVIEYIEGVVGLVPNPEYSAKKVFNIQGVGSIFSGNYYFKTVRHTIGGETYTVEADVAKMDNISFSTTTDTSSNNVRADRPATPQPAPTSPSNPNYIMHHIVWGETLSKLARKYYGNGSLYMRIYEANRDTVKNPNMIYAGKWLRIPK